MVTEIIADNKSKHQDTRKINEMKVPTEQERAEEKKMGRGETDFRFC